MRLPATRAALLPTGFILVLAALGARASIEEQPALWWSITGAGVFLFVWTVLLFGRAAATGRTLTLSVVARPQHYLQACAQASVLLYWGWYWRTVYESADLIAAQLLFAYAFDLLLAWSRRDEHTLGFAPFPIIFSINLFLWFKSDWFFLQFAMIAVGVTAKETIRWTRDGRRTHVFNPSSFPLALFSIGLILTGSSGMTWGKEIAITQFFPPHMYLMLFLIGLPGQYFFGVTSMTMAAVVTTYILGFVYFLATGTYFFFDSDIPIAVFLGMHLLFTDPSTSPRTDLGRVMFGVMYGASTMVLYAVLGSLGVPTFYDKLLQVPVLNLSVRELDRIARSPWLQRFDPGALGRGLVPRHRNLAYIGVWAVVFTFMSVIGAVGDDHPGQWVPFWRRACAQERPYACAYLASLEATLCQAESGWACNELGILQVERQLDDGPGVRASFEDGCRFGFLSACRNLTAIATGASAPISSPPTLEDYPVLLRGSKGPIADRSPASLHARACAQGWPDACADAVAAGRR